FFILVILATVALAQLPGSNNGIIANGKGGLGRYIRHLEQGGQPYAGYGNFGYAPAAYSPFGFFELPIMRSLLVLFLIFVAIATQHILPGSYSGAVANGRGGLGRYIRHLEHHDVDSYYGNGNGF
ncbi:hypothetical protein PFISCL1PPCAC_13015, partial [Pristionchus fissidentatus]